MEKRPENLREGELMKRQLAITAIAATSLLLGSCQKDPESRPYKTNQPEDPTGSIKSLYQQVVYVLLYNAGSAQEGIHSLDHDDETVVILLFEDKQDAVAFADKLKAQNFPAPTVSALTRKDVEDFAIQAGYKLRFVRTGDKIYPPTSNSPTLRRQSKRNLKN